MSSKLVEGKNSFPFPKWARIIVAITGLVLFSYSIVTFFSADMGKLKYTFPYTIIAMGCMFVAGFEKRTYLSDEGIVREYRTWGSKGHDTVPWSEISGVRILRGDSYDSATFIREGKNMTMVVEKKDNKKLADTMETFIPGVSVEEFS